MTETFSRREVLGAMTALAAGAALPAVQAGDTALPLDGYWLSAGNPIANVDQREVEDVAVRLLAHPDVARAREQAGMLWRSVMEQASGAQWPLFEPMLDEYVYNYALKAALADPDRPRVARVYTPPWRWLGRAVPGSRWGGDNPDNTYRLIPIAAGARYELQGRRMAGGIANVTYTLVGNTATSVTLSSLEGRDLHTAPDGSFTITVDDRPAAGRVNHIQSKPGALYLFVRDSCSDWERQTPNALRIARLDPPARTAPGIDEMAQFAARHMVEDVYLVYWFERLSYGVPLNTMRVPRNSGGVGGLRSQVGSQGVFTIGDDEAVVVTANAAGAAYRNFVVHDVWYRSIEPWKRQSSLTDAQMAADADGRFTFVVAHEDPGVHNWVDTAGLHEVLALHRWQGLPPDPQAPAPEIACRRVKLRDLDQALPAGVKTVTPDERASQIARREAAYLRRYIET
ncbi:MAG: hypothetical protein AB7Q97_07870 [Gammaproteobacteria bacterium]